MPNIMVAGSAIGYTEAQESLARELGEVIAKARGVLVNGATSGLPFIAAEAAKSAGGHIWAVSPAVDIDEHLEFFGFPQYDLADMLFTGSSADETWEQCVGRFTALWTPDVLEELKKQFRLKFRNPISVVIADAVIAIGGRIGTINELTTASDFAKPIGIVKKGGGTAEGFPELVSRSGKQKAEILIGSPKELVDRLMQIVEV